MLAVLGPVVVAGFGVVSTGVGARGYRPCMNLTGTNVDVFQRAWDRFERLLAERSPEDRVTLRPPATAARIDALEARLGFPLHPQLRALLERHDGVPDAEASWDLDHFQAGAFLPLGHRLDGADAIASAYSGIVTLAEDFEADFDPADYVDDFRENHVDGHILRWVPFAHPNDGGIAFVYHQPGPMYGHVYEIGLGSGCWPPVEWATSLAEFFDLLARSLEDGTPFQDSRPTAHRHSSGRNTLEWT